MLTRAFTSSSIHSFPHSLHPCALSQGARTFLPSSLLISGGSHPFLLYLLPVSFPLFCSDLSALCYESLPFFHLSIPPYPRRELVSSLSPSISPSMLLFPLTQPRAFCGRCICWMSGEHMCLYSVCVCMCVRVCDFVLGCRDTEGGEGG